MRQRFGWGCKGDGAEEDLLPEPTAQRRIQAGEVTFNLTDRRSPNGYPQPPD
jgi:hypothetical protein